MVDDNRHSIFVLVSQHFVGHKMVDDLFDTHKFLFTLSYENRFEGYSIEYLDSKNELKTVRIKQLIVNTSPISFRVIDFNDQKVAIGYVRVVKIYDSNNELVWDMSDREFPDVKVIGGYD